MNSLRRGIRGIQRVFRPEGIKRGVATASGALTGLVTGGPAGMVTGGVNANLRYNPDENWGETVLRGAYRGGAAGVPTGAISGQGLFATSTATPTTATEAGGYAFKKPLTIGGGGSTATTSGATALSNPYSWARTPLGKAGMEAGVSLLTQRIGNAQSMREAKRDYLYDLEGLQRSKLMNDILLRREMTRRGNLQGLSSAYAEGERNINENFARNAAQMRRVYKRSKPTFGNIWKQSASQIMGSVALGGLETAGVLPVSYDKSGKAVYYNQ